MAVADEHRAPLVFRYALDAAQDLTEVRTAQIVYDDADDRRAGTRERLCIRVAYVVQVTRGDHDLVAQGLADAALAAVDDA